MSTMSNTEIFHEDHRLCKTAIPVSLRTQLPQKYHDVFRRSFKAQFFFCINITDSSLIVLQNKLKNGSQSVFMFMGV